MEYVGDYLLGNIWYTDYIFIYHPLQKIQWIDLRNISLTDTYSNFSGNVLNGIAYDYVDRRLFITGKRWNRIFDIQLELLNQDHSPENFIEVSNFMSNYNKGVLSVLELIKYMNKNKITSSCFNLNITKNKIINNILHYKNSI